MKPGFPPFPFGPLFSSQQQNSWLWQKQQLKAWKLQQKASWRWHKEQMRLQRKAQRPHSFLGGLFGMLWSLCVIAAVFYFVFGGPDARALFWDLTRVLMNVTRDLFLALRDALSSVLGAVQ